MELRVCECGAPARVYTNLGKNLVQAKVCCTRCHEATHYFSVGKLQQSVEAASKYWNNVYLVEKLRSLRVELRNLKNPPPPPLSGEQLALL